MPGTHSNYDSLTSCPQSCFNISNNCVMMETFGSQRFQWELRIIGDGKTNSICIKIHMGKKENINWIIIFQAYFQCLLYLFSLTATFRMDFARAVNEHAFPKMHFFFLYLMVINYGKQFLTFPHSFLCFQTCTLGSEKIINCGDCLLSIATYNYKTVK